MSQHLKKTVCHFENSFTGQGYLASMDLGHDFGSMQKRRQTLESGLSRRNVDDQNAGHHIHGNRRIQLSAASEVACQALLCEVQTPLAAIVFWCPSIYR